VMQMDDKRTPKKF